MHKRHPERRCIVTGEVHPQSALLRFAISPDDVVIPDIKGQLPGRGMWIIPERDALEQAIAKNRFSYAAKQKVITPDDLIDKTSSLMRQHALNYIGRARQAKLLLNGFEKVAAALRACDTNTHLLLHAEDAGKDGISKLNALAQNEGVVQFGTREELSNATGISNPVHLLIQDDGIITAFLASYRRWAGFLRKDTV